MIASPWKLQWGYENSRMYPCPMRSPTCSSLFRYTTCTEWYAKYSDIGIKRIRQAKSFSRQTLLQQGYLTKVLDNQKILQNDILPVSENWKTDIWGRDSPTSTSRFPLGNQHPLFNIYTDIIFENYFRPLPALTRTCSGFSEPKREIKQSNGSACFNARILT